jgi:murein DD-endopeptidase MepM/ murein hydrolase activator NlpD
MTPSSTTSHRRASVRGNVRDVLAYALLFAYLEDGVPGVRAWLAAKFLNRVPGDPTPSTTSSTTSSGTSSSAPRTNTALYRSPIGAAGEPAGFTFPVMGGARFSDDWGQARSGGRKHEGTDLFAPRGSPVVAAVAGTVLDDFTDSLGGNVVRVLGLDGRRYYYAHLNSVSATAGALVAAGDALGTVGNTGNARGADPHLHFGVYESIAGKWRARDPFAWLSDALSGPRSRSSAAGWA